jgi:hypothetical protein
VDAMALEFTMLASGCVNGVTLMEYVGRMCIGIGIENGKSWLYQLKRELGQVVDMLSLRSGCDRHAWLVTLCHI